MDAITSYATLKAAIPGMMKLEGDVQITGNVALFIQLAEADFPDRLFPREEEYETTLTGTVSSATIDLPSDYISPIALWITVDSERSLLNKVQPQQLPYDTDDNEPALWAIDGAWIRFDCPCAQAYTFPFRYLRKTDLSDANPTNYLLRRRPDLYLYGALKQAAIFREDDPAIEAVDWRPLCCRDRRDGRGCQRGD